MFCRNPSFLTISCNKISSLFKTRISVNESNFPDLLIRRILKIRFVYLIAFFYFYNIVMSEKFWSQSFVNYTASEKDQKTGSFMNVPICKLCFSLKRPKPCFSKIQLLWRSYVMTYHVFQRDVFHAANEWFLETLGVIFLVYFYIIPVDTKKCFDAKWKKLGTPVAKYIMSL